ncbi:MAG: hypothetical protein WA751_09105 [Candidatus Dormiibacterota bacterium]
MSGAARAEPPEPRPPGSFQGWQRGACLIAVGLLALFALLLLVILGLGAVGVH